MRLRSAFPALLLVLGALPMPAAAQQPAMVTEAPPRPEAPQRITAVYDEAEDLTVLQVVLDKGRYFIRWHRPRVTAQVTHAGRHPSVVPDSLLLEFRTQSPQYTSTNILTWSTSAGDTLRATATASRVRERSLTTDHTLAFSVPFDRLPALLGAPAGELEVGGVRFRLTARHLEGLRALVQRASPPPGDRSE